MLTLDDLRKALEPYGVLSPGGHDPIDGRCCVRELRSLALGRGLDDRPDGIVSELDFLVHHLNDAFDDDAERTKWCLPLGLLTVMNAPPEWSSEVPTPEEIRHTPYWELPALVRKTYALLRGEGMPADPWEGM